MQLCDGGEGSSSILADALNGDIIDVKVHNPLGKIISSTYTIIDNKQAIIEMASSSGIELLREDEKNPLLANSYGFGELILDALDRGVRSFLLCIGGSATNDVGIGMLEALGVLFLDKSGKKIDLCPKNINKIASIDINNLDDRIKQSDIKVACDVSNTLCGKDGASFVFGAQKGANEDMRVLLDKHLSHFADISQNTLSEDNRNIIGVGAGGGIGFALVGFLNASLQSGIELISNILRLEDKIKNADLVITGEGQMDKQSIYGKVPLGVAKISKRYNIPVIAIVGSQGDGAEQMYKYGIDMIFDTTPNLMTQKKLFANANMHIENASTNIAKALNFYKLKS